MGLKKLFDSGYRELKKDMVIANKVLEYDEAMQKLTDEELKNKTNEFRERYKNGESLDSLLPEAYAVAREASYRVTNKKPFFVQVVGGIAINGGNIAEMKTGEGKTLTAVLPAYLNALTGDGVHIVTVNEYLAAREANGEIGEIFKFLGMTVGLNLRDKSREEKKEAYDCDILYTTNSELGFDYLRDHMVVYKNDLVQLRGLNYAIVDEVDSILIDEARTPLIISGGAKNNGALYIQADTFAKRLADEDYEIDVESRTIALTPSGMDKAERFFGIDNLYDLKYVSIVHSIDNALKANYIFARDKDYVVDNGEVLIVDQFTGRILKGRQWSEGLHQAVEAKEHCEIKKETITVATITYQNFFRMYKKLSGMTGTAKTEEEEFRDIYNMYVVEVPTNKPCIREDAVDFIYSSQKYKYQAIVNEVVERHAKGQPILLGTIAVETSELLSKMLTKAGIKHEVLNAKNHAREAEIIEKAGQMGAVTIATNMAGRGTDIKLGEGVAELGGLAVLGTERHESRRIDNQLRGRSGRQGDPGFTRFFISTEDELMERFGSDTFRARLNYIIALSGEEDPSKPLEMKMMANFVKQAQTRIEGQNYDARKNVLKYDEVIGRQRELFYSQRTEIILKDDIEENVLKMVHNAIEDVTSIHMKEVGHNKYDIDDEAICNLFNTEVFGPNKVSLEEIKKRDEVEIIDYLYQIALHEIEVKKAIFPPDIFKEFLKVITLRVIDTYWTSHIDAMSELRQGVTLQAYGQNNPLIVFQKEGHDMYEKMIYKINLDVTKYLIRAQVRSNVVREEVNKDVSTNDVTQTIKKAPIQKQKEPGPNDPCPCGSGLKYKYCCKNKK